MQQAEHDHDTRHPLQQGATDVRDWLGITLGYRPLRSRLRVYHEVLAGRSGGGDPFSRMQMGKDLEPLFPKWAEIHSGLDLFPAAPENCRDGKKLDLPWLVPHTDFYALDEDKSRFACAEAKWTPFGRADWGVDRSTQVRMDYLVQLQAQMLCEELKFGFLCVRFTDEFCVFPVEADVALQEKIIEASRELYQATFLEQPPDPIPGEENLRWPTATPKSSVVATPAVMEAFEMVREFKVELDAADTHKAQAAHVVKTFMNTNEVLLTPNGKPIATYRNSAKGRRFCPNYEAKTDAT